MYKRCSTRKQDFRMSTAIPANAQPEAAWRPVQLVFNPAIGSYELHTEHGAVAANDCEPVAEAIQDEAFSFDLLGWVALCGPAWGNVFNGPFPERGFDDRPAALESAPGLATASVAPAVRLEAESVRQGLALYA